MEPHRDAPIRVHRGVLLRPSDLDTDLDAVPGKPLQHLREAAAVHAGDLADPLKEGHVVAAVTPHLAVLLVGAFGDDEQHCPFGHGEACGGWAAQPVGDLANETTTHI
jgi:hypothetical protein